MQSACQGGCPVPIFFGQGVIQMQTSALFVAKTNIEFFKIYSVSTSDMDRGEGRGIEPVLTIFGQGEVNFS